MTKYNQEIESQMLHFYSSLKEKAKRHYASIEAQKLGYGGKKYISILLGISQKTIRKGDTELKSPTYNDEISPFRQRKKGGGGVFFCPTS